jgi:hypothetical protein
MNDIQPLGRSANGIIAAFVFNLEEPGVHNWVDCREYKIVVPSWYRDDRIKVPVEREGNRNSLLICIAANEIHLKPFLILLRKIIDQELAK